MFTAPAVDLVANTGPGHLGRYYESRVRGLPAFGGELPVAVLAEEILTEGRGPDPRSADHCRQPCPFDAGWRAVGSCARRASISWWRWISISTKPPATQTSSCRRHRPSNTTTTIWFSTFWRCAMWHGIRLPIFDPEPGSTARLADPGRAPAAVGCRVPPGRGSGGGSNAALGPTADPRSGAAKWAMGRGAGPVRQGPQPEHFGEGSARRRPGPAGALSCRDRLRTPRRRSSWRRPRSWRM